MEPFYGNLPGPDWKDGQVGWVAQLRLNGEWVTCPTDSPNEYFFEDYYAACDTLADNALRVGASFHDRRVIPVIQGENIERDRERREAIPKFALLAWLIQLTIFILIIGVFSWLIGK